MSIYSRNTVMRFQQYLPAVGTVLFTRAPRIGYAPDLGRDTQQLDFDSDGEARVYSRRLTGTATHALEWSIQPLAVLDALKLFFKEMNGNKRLFAFIDHSGAWHKVKFVNGSLSWRAVGRDKYAIKVTVIEEDVSLDIDYPLNNPVTNEIIASTGETIFDHAGGNFNGA